MAFEREGSSLGRAFPQACGPRPLHPTCPTPPGEIVAATGTGEGAEALSSKSTSTSKLTPATTPPHSRPHSEAPRPSCSKTSSPPPPPLPQTPQLEKPQLRHQSVVHHDLEPEIGAAATEPVTSATAPVDGDNTANRINKINNNNNNNHDDDDDDSDFEMGPQAKVRTFLEKTAFKQDPGKPQAGGLDKTPLPRVPNGYTVKFTFHKATHLPVADLSTLSCDPYVVAELKTNLPPRHKDIPPLRYRTQSIQRSVNPEWEESWIVANVPSSGFELKCRLYDEDFPDNDDKLGTATVTVSTSDLQNGPIDHQKIELKKSRGAKIVFLSHRLLSCMQRQSPDSYLEISIELLRRTGDEDNAPPNQGTRMFTVGPGWMRRHYSPMLGMFVGVKDTERGPDSREPGKVEKGYNFQANEFQLLGPVPAELYHRYVAYRPSIGLLFSKKTLAGYIISHILHHQHRRVYNYDATTRYVRFEQPASRPEDMTRWFLDSTHYGRGGRVFTYVILLDGVMRFTETGKEFGIDGLSKHALHSDGNPYIAYSGEFFVRRRRNHHHKRPSSQDGEGVDPDHQIQGGGKKEEEQRQDEAEARKAQEDDFNEGDAIEADDGILPTTIPGLNSLAGFKPKKASVQNKDGNKGLGHGNEQAQDHEHHGRDGSTDSRPRDSDAHSRPSTPVLPDVDPSDYELVIDNESGTYRPSGELLDSLVEYLSRSFPGLSIIALDGQKDTDKLKELKKKQEDDKEKAREKAGRRFFFRQHKKSGSDSSLSSSDVEYLNSMGQHAAASSSAGNKKSEKTEVSSKSEGGNGDSSSKGKERQ